MNRKIPYSPSELKVVDTFPGFLGGPGVPMRNIPISSKENVASLYWEKSPYWIPTTSDNGFFFCPMYDKNLGRGPSGQGTTDCFGLVWEWIEAAGGAIVRPGEPLLKNANDWKEVVKIPDIDKWDWAGEAERVKADPRRFTQMSLINGFWFERLVSFMDFAEAAVALIDEDQKDAITELFTETTSLACKLVDKFCEYWPGIDGFNVHDDWGAQKDPFFSEAVARELFLPHMRRLTDHIHSKGRVATLHSCGHIEARIQVLIDAGFDEWTPQLMNDTQKLYNEYGDKIVIAVVPDPFDPAVTPEDEQRRRARDFVDNFAKKDRPTVIDFYGARALTPAFSDELYEYSRRKYYGA